MPTIQLRRGLKANLPASAASGEVLITTDTNEIFIGTGVGKTPLIIDASNITNLPTASIFTNAQTGASYTVLDSDRNKLLTFSNASPVAVILPQAGASSQFISGWYAHFENKGASDVTITPATSTIDGAASFVLHQNQGLLIASDGTNYQVVRGLQISALTAVASRWVNAISASGVASTSQPAFTDISGALSATQLPAIVDGGTF